MWNQCPSDFACVAKGFDRTRKLAEELHKPVIRKLEKRKIYPSFKDIICGADLVLSKYNKELLFNYVLSIFLASMRWLFP